MSTLSDYIQAQTIETDYQRTEEEIVVILRTQKHDRSALDAVNWWLLTQCVEYRPDLSKWERPIWLERMRIIERRLKQAYDNLGIKPAHDE